MSSNAFDLSEAYTINGVHTEILLHKFTNKYLLFITQYEKLNNVFVACNDIAFTGMVQNRELNVKHLFGTTSDEIECGIRFLLTKSTLAATFRNDLEIVVCLGLKEYGPVVLKAIKGVLDVLGKTETTSIWMVWRYYLETILSLLFKMKIKSKLIWNG